VSAGVSSLTDGADVEALMGMADRALYRAKASGRNATARHEDERQTGHGGTPPLLHSSSRR
jgi:predicted signal transduction protein with EAL and GGDEF domain